MRRILIESARRKNSLKRGGNSRHIIADQFDVAAALDIDIDLLLDVDEGLSRLAQEEPQMAELLKLRLFAGLSVTEAGKTLGMSRSTAYENWQFIRSWFAVYVPKAGQRKHEGRAD
jgi:RNA polymerase sigma factor (TIGR02999 family)